jgi:transcriptional regulator with XRE-family HTH domain
MGLRATKLRHEDLTPFGVALVGDARGRVELAHLIGVDPATLWRWATGRSRPSSEALRREAARALGRDVAELWPVDAPEQPEQVAA